MKSQHINELIREIKVSEHKWKALYHATHIAAAKIKEDHKDIKDWEKYPITYALPASGIQSHTYPSGEYLIEIMTTRDGEIALNHTITLLSLLEKLLKKMNIYLYPEKPGVDLAHRESLIEYLRDKHLLSDDDLYEFKLATKTRDCVIHNGHIATKRWVKLFNNRKRTHMLIHKTNDLYILVRLPQVEKWHKLFLKVLDSTEKFIHEKESRVNFY